MTQNTPNPGRPNGSQILLVGDHPIVRERLGQVIAGKRELCAGGWLRRFI